MCCRIFKACSQEPPQIKAEYGIDHEVVRGKLRDARARFVKYCFDELKEQTADSLLMPKLALARIVERARYVEVVSVTRAAISVTQVD